MRPRQIDERRLPARVPGVAPAVAVGVVEVVGACHVVVGSTTATRAAAVRPGGRRAARSRRGRRRRSTGRSRRRSASRPRSATGTVPGWFAFARPVHRDRRADRDAVDHVVRVGRHLSRGRCATSAPSAPAHRCAGRASTVSPGFALRMANAASTPSTRATPRAVTAWPPPRTGCAVSRTMYVRAGSVAAGRHCTRARRRATRRGAVLSSDCATATGCSDAAPCPVSSTSSETSDGRDSANCSRAATRPEPGPSVVERDGVPGERPAAVADAETREQGRDAERRGAAAERSCEPEPGEGEQAAAGSGPAHRFRTLAPVCKDGLTNVPRPPPRRPIQLDLRHAPHRRSVRRG